MPQIESANPTAIRLRGVSVNNLRAVDLDLPHRQLIALCGVSGSGKTSLALDTLYAEGQRRYMESFSTATRQFLQQWDKPAADSITGLPPALGVERKHAARSSRATVGSATQINQPLQVLWARLGTVMCHGCGQPVTHDSAESAAAWLAQFPPGTKLMLGFATPRDDAQEDAAWLADLLALGYRRVVCAGQVIDLAMADDAVLAGTPAVEVVLDRLVVATAAELRLLDRLVVATAAELRLRDSLENALAAGHGGCVVWLDAREAPGGEDTPVRSRTLDRRDWLERRFSQFFRCAACNLDYPPPTPQLVSLDASCDTSAGTNASPVALKVHWGGLSLAAVGELKICEALPWFRDLKLSSSQQELGRLLLEQVVTKLEYLEQVGLGHVQLARPLATLSTGEAQRVALTAALGSNLMGMLYVLDEPCVGLHPHDMPAVVQAIHQLRDRGNTVVVVEHQPDLLVAADHIVELGPGAGTDGGRVIFQGPPQALLGSQASRTGQWLAGQRTVGKVGQRRPANQGWLRLQGARGNYLQDLTVPFPLGVLCVVAGVSGAGKSTLVQQTLFPAVAEQLQFKVEPGAPYTELQGATQLDDAVLMDQSPIGRTPRSNPVTYIKAFAPIRTLFANTSAAQARGLKAGDFSFNVAGGRCEACQGAGFTQIDMRLMADVYLRCHDCQGQRYRREVLDVKYRGRHIAEVLDLTVREAFAFFRGQRKILARLKCLLDVGLDYLRLGQPANTLSGGEAQRLKMATYIAAPRRGRTLFVLDEPTQGLHFSDVLQLLDCFDSLLAMGHTLVVVEHNLLLMQAADYIIELGPGPAAAGGRVVACGTPEELADHPDSLTGKYLAPQLRRAAAAQEEA